MKFKQELQQAMLLKPKWASMCIDYRGLEAIIKKFKHLKELNGHGDDTEEKESRIREEFFDQLREEVAGFDSTYRELYAGMESALNYQESQLNLEIPVREPSAIENGTTVVVNVPNHKPEFNPYARITDDELSGRVRELQSIYIDLLDLDSIRNLMREAARKIVKKYDKASGETNQDAFMRDEVDIRSFVRDDLKRLQDKLLEVARRCFGEGEIGNMELRNFQKKVFEMRRKQIQTLTPLHSMKQYLIIAAVFGAIWIWLALMVQPQFSATKNWQGYVVIFALAFAVYSIASLGKPADLCLMTANIVFLTLSIINMEEAFAGFSNAGVIANGILLPYARALSIAGGAELLLMKCLGSPKTEWKAQFNMSVVVATLSSVLNNTPIVFMMIPILQTWCNRMNKSVSKFMMPMSFAIMLGGTCSIVGSSANLVTIGMASSFIGNYPPGKQPVYNHPGFWQPAWVGVPVALVGIIWMIISAPFLLPERIKASGGEDGSPRGGAKSLKTPGLFASSARFTVPFRFTGSLIGMRVEDTGLTRVGNDERATVLGIIPANASRNMLDAYIVPPIKGSWDHIIQEGDVIVFNCSSQNVNTIRQIQGMELDNKHLSKLTGDRRERCLVECVVGNRSPFLGRSIVDFDFRRRMNACAIAFDRRGEDDFSCDIKQIFEFKRKELKKGDVLLIEASRKSAVGDWPKDGIFSQITAVEHSAPPMRNWKNMVITMGSLALLVLLTSLEIVDIVTLGFIIVATFITLNVITIKEAWGSVKGDVLLTIAASFGIGQAMSNSGLAIWIGGLITDICNGSELGVLFMVYFFTVVLGTILNNASVAVLVYPVAYAACVENAGIDPEMVVLLIIMGAGLSFCTPMSYQTNQMVQGPGGYEFGDYVRFGGCLQVVTGIASVTFLYLLANMGIIRHHHSVIPA